jgi:class 3 adenylate cyclase/TolB-like protein/Flp pilus assembly protein TadD
MAEGRTNRRLAAILAADVVGYSRLMARDEVRTLDRLKSVLSDIVEPEINENGGRTVKLMGDGVLAEFPSVVGAAECALAVQSRLLADQADLSDDERIMLRIGINLGDIIVEANDIYGDGVNVAARLESLAEPNTVYVSGAVYDQLKTKLSVAFDFLGEKTVKNIQESIRVYRVRCERSENPNADGRPASRSRSPVPRKWFAVAIAALLSVATIAGYQYLNAPVPETIRQDTSAVPEDRPTITVLPLEIVGDQSSDQYFASGISQDIMEALIHLSDLMVIAPDRNVTDGGEGLSSALVGNKSVARFVVGGTLARNADSLRINVQLVDTATGENLWSKTYNRSNDTLSSLSDEIVGAIVPLLPIGQAAANDFRSSYTYFPEPEAYDLYLKGNLSFGRFSPASLEEAKRLYQEAAKIDPKYARPLANLAFVISLSVSFGWSDAPEEDLEKVARLTDRALALDPRVHQAYLARGVSLRSQRRYDEAIEALKKALEIAPNHADAYAMISLTYVFSGHPEEGLTAIENAMNRDPGHPLYYLYDRAMALFHLDRFDEAIEPLRLALEKNPEFLPARLLLASAYAHLDRLEEASWEYEEILARKPDFTLLQEQARIPYADPNDLFLYMDGLRAAASGER